MMRNWTGIEIQEERSRLERETATVLGYLLFEYSRLDTALGLYLAWSNDGQTLEELTKKLSDYNFYERLKFLQKAVLDKFSDSTEIVENYANWLDDAHRIRSIRNQLFHGRWGFNPMQQQVVNVVGLPTSPEQCVTPYFMEDLQRELESLRELTRRLEWLRSLWPV